MTWGVWSMGTRETRGAFFSISSRRERCGSSSYFHVKSADPDIVGASCNDATNTYSADIADATENVGIAASPSGGNPLARRLAPVWAQELWERVGRAVSSYLTVVDAPSSMTASGASPAGAPRTQERALFWAGAIVGGLVP